MFTFPVTIGRGKKRAPVPRIYRYVDCATGLTTIAHFTLADKPDDYSWVNDGTVCCVKARLDGLDSEEPTSPVPCSVEMASTPGSCEDLNFEPFQAPTSGPVDECAWVPRFTDGTVATSGGKLRYTVDAGNPKDLWRYVSCQMDGDFTATITLDVVSFLSSTTVNQSAGFRFETCSGSFVYQLSIEKISASSTTTWRLISAGSGTTVETTSASGTTFSFRVTRSGSSVSGEYKIGGGSWTSATETNTSSDDILCTVWCGSRWAGGNFTVDWSSHTII